MGGETVVLDLTSGCYYGLDEVGARVWSLIERPSALESIRDTIMAEYDVPVEQCEQDILAFVDRMRSAGLIDLTSESDA